MTKRVHKIAASIVAMATVFCMAGYLPSMQLQNDSIIANAEDWMTVTKTGSCGDGVTWTLVADLMKMTGTMTISGKGKMTSAPQYEESGTDTYKNSVMPYVTKVVVESGITEISDNAFRDHTFLREVILPDTVKKIGICAFGECSNLSSVDLPAGLTSIGDGAFKDCSVLSDIKIPDTVTQIGTLAFYQCNGLTEITIPNSVTFIDDHAFANCIQLENVNIPKSLTDFGAIPFYDTKWEKAQLSEQGYVVVNGVLLEMATPEASPCYIPDGVTALAGWSLVDASAKMKEFVIPESVKKIDDEVFGTEEGNNKKGVTIYGVPNSYAQTWAKANGVTFKNVETLNSTSTEPPKTLAGDVNADGTVSVSDVVLFQKWLLAVPDTHLDNWRNADMNDDWELDVFDLCLMKRALLKSTPSETPGEYVLHTAEAMDIEWETYSDFSVNMQIPKGWAVSCTTPKDDMFALRYEVASPDHDCRIVYMVSDPNTWYNSKEYATNLAESMRNEVYTEVKRAAEYVRWLTESSVKGWCEGSADYGNSTFEILDEVKLNEASYYEDTKQFHQYDVARIHGKRTTKEGKIYEGLYRAGVYGPENSEPKTNPITGELWDYPSFTVNGVRIMEAPAEEFDSWLPVLQKSLYSLEFTDEYKSMLSTAVSAKSAALGDMIGDTVSVAKYSDATLGYERVCDNDTGDIYMAYSGFLEDRAKLGDDRFTAATDTMYTQTISGWIEEK